MCVEPEGGEVSGEDAAAVFEETFGLSKQYFGLMECARRGGGKQLEIGGMTGQEVGETGRQFVGFQLGGVTAFLVEKIGGQQ